MPTGNQSVNGGNVDHSTPATGAHHRQDLSDEPEWCRQVNLDDAVPVIVGKCFDRGNMLYAGIVNQNINDAEAVQSICSQSLHLNWVGKVGIAERYFIHTRVAQIGDCIFDHRRFFDSIEHQPATSLGQLTSDFETDPTG